VGQALPPANTDRLRPQHCFTEIVQFEDSFRAALTPYGRVERAAEVAFWKNFGAFLAKTKITNALLTHLSMPSAWERFVTAVKNLAAEPTWGNFGNLIESCGMKLGFATPLTFLSFYDPKNFPMSTSESENGGPSDFQASPNSHGTEKLSRRVNSPGRPTWRRQRSAAAKPPNCPL
jgi:hypothetical protein